MIEFKLTPVEHNGQRVLTTAQLAEAYETDVKVISKNFNRNKDHFIEGVHFYRLTGKELEKFCIRQNDECKNYGKIRVIYLWTERGALLHAKSLNTEKAWEVYEFLVDTYFRVREIDSYVEMLCRKLETLEQKLETAEQERVAIKQKLEMSEKRDDIIYQKLEISEKRIDTLEINIKKSITDNLYNVINTLNPAFECIYNKINKSTYMLLYKNYKKNKKRKNKST
ncbi:MAG: ORF6N domain-containing protein [Ruminococcus sp.]|nr:ORF6N domain-containing protein [Ruminococcus sp.]